MRSQISVVILAAGLSNRMGAINKLLIPIEGVPMIRRAVILYLSLFSSVTVVTGFQSEKIENALEGLPVNYAFNPDFENGQQGSVDVGLSSLSMPRSGVLIALGDQPFLTKVDIATYCEVFLASSKDKVFIPQYKSQRGNPVLFPVSIIKHLIESGQSASCRKFLDLNPDLCAVYNAPTSHFVDDIDTPEAARNLALTRGVLAKVKAEDNHHV